ncbi:MAG: sugar ABC transporter ATP-binding protein [Christensenellaceae bacterium]|nr:sugar ABC transporter ATP-binding protein [Christensenellaceae bacterium]
MGTESTPVLKMVDIVKEFPGVRALKGVSFDVIPGEAHALIGENGAGKSTLIKAMMGVYPPTSGEIYVDGEKVKVRDPQHAQTLGLGAVYQDISLAMSLSVGENFFIGNLPKTKFGLVDWKKIYKEAQETLDELHINVNAKTLVRDLTIGQQEMVSIARVVHQKAKVIVFDEPTALLANEEVEILFKLIRQIKDMGVGVIYISHRLEEIFQICDRITVLKDGSYVDTVKVTDIDQDGLVQMMVGRDLTNMYDIEHFPKGECALKVEGLTSKGVFEDISFECYKGQIMGMFGLIGAGRTEICKAIFGADKYDSGKIYLNGEEFKPKNPRQAMKKGIALLPEDRKKEGLCLGLSVDFNTNLGSYDLISKFGIISLKQEHARTRQRIQEMATKTPSINQLVRNLSGGNQQKVVIGKWLCRDGDVMIFDEPTVGVDVGAKAEIYKLLEQLTRRGKCIILISSYLPEIMGLSDEMMVIAEGKLMGIIDRSEFVKNGKLDEERALRLASGISEG